METKISMGLAEKLTMLRKQKGLTQMELAERLNVSRQAISRWEVGAAVPSTDNLRFLGDLYEVPIDYLLNDDAENSYNAPEITETEPEKQGKDCKYKRIVIWTLIIMVFIAVATGVTKIQKQGRDQPVPIEDMTIEDGDDYSEVTFPFE